MKYTLDERMSKEISKAAKTKGYETMHGVITITGNDAETGQYKEVKLTVKGKIITSTYEGTDSVFRPRFDGEVAFEGATIIDKTLYAEFPIPANMNPKALARSIAYNLGVLTGFEN